MERKRLRTMISVVPLAKRKDRPVIKSKVQLRNLDSNLYELDDLRY